MYQLTEKELKVIPVNYHSMYSKLSESERKKLFISFGGVEESLFDGIPIVSFMYDDVFVVPSSFYDEDDFVPAESGFSMNQSKDVYETYVTENFEDDEPEEMKQNIKKAIYVLGYLHEKHNGKDHHKFLHMKEALAQKLLEI